MNIRKRFTVLPIILGLLLAAGFMLVPIRINAGSFTNGLRALAAKEDQVIRFMSEIPAASVQMDWVGGFSRPGVFGTIYALVADGKGNLYAGGTFELTSGGAANYIAKWDGNRWSPLGSGMNMWVSALAVDSNGILYAGGWFTEAGGKTANYIAKWDGSQWSPLGTGMDDRVNALVVDGSGNLYAGGQFASAGGVTVNSIAKWDGSQWTAMDGGMGYQFTPRVLALEMDGSGNLYVGGSFSEAGSVAANRIAKWDGSQWSALGAGLDGTVQALKMNSGNLYAGGWFKNAGEGGANRIAKWDGSSWSGLGGGVDAPVEGIAVDTSGKVYATGWFTKAGVVDAKYIAMWDNSGWTSLGTGLEDKGRALVFDRSGALIAAGDFKTAGGVVVNNIAQWNRGTWGTIGSGKGFNFPVSALAMDGAYLYAGGDFTEAGGKFIDYIARWDGSDWSHLGSGVNGGVDVLLPDGEGNLFVGGAFTLAGEEWVNHIAKWDGNSWSALGDGFQGDVRALAMDDDGILYAGGTFTLTGAVEVNHIAKWDGSSWSALKRGMDGNVSALVVDQSGNLYAGGRFDSAGGGHDWGGDGVNAHGIAKWNGVEWEALGPFVLGELVDVNALMIDPDTGVLYAGGLFSKISGVAANNVAKWDGSSWSALGSGLKPGVFSNVSTLAMDSEGLIFAGGSFTMTGEVDAQVVNCIAKWDGKSWSALGTGMVGLDEISRGVYALAVDGSDNLYVGGLFNQAGDKASWNIALWRGFGSNQIYLPLVLR
jgi:hypothetical protein